MEGQGVAPAGWGAPGGPDGQGGQPPVWHSARAGGAFQGYTSTWLGPSDTAHQAEGGPRGTPPRGGQQQPMWRASTSGPAWQMAQGTAWAGPSTGPPPLRQYDQPWQQQPGGGTTGGAASARGRQGAGEGEGAWQQQQGLDGGPSATWPGRTYDLAAHRGSPPERPEALARMVSNLPRQQGGGWMVGAPASQAPGPWASAASPPVLRPDGSVDPFTRGMVAPPGWVGAYGAEYSSIGMLQAQQAAASMPGGAEAWAENDAEAQYVGAFGEGAPGSTVPDLLVTREAVRDGVHPQELALRMVGAAQREVGRDFFLLPPVCTREHSTVYEQCKTEHPASTNSLK